MLHLNLAVLVHNLSLDGETTYISLILDFAARGEDCPDYVATRSRYRAISLSSSEKKEKNKKKQIVIHNDLDEGAEGEHEGPFSETGVVRKEEYELTFRLTRAIQPNGKRPDHLSLTLRQLRSFCATSMSIMRNRLLASYFRI